MKTMKKRLLLFLFVSLLLASGQRMWAQERRPIDNEHPLWLIHVDVWNKADPQKIIDLIPEDVRPYVCMNLSLSCGYDKERNVYKMPQQAVRTYKSWATVCQKNGLWFTCQPASGGHTHIQDDDLATFEYFYKRYPNFLGWNYAEQFWGFDESGDLSSSTQASRLALFAKLVPMAHQYGGFLTVSFCGNVWSHPLNPLGMMKRNTALLKACHDYPEAILWLYKYTTSSCFYNNESVTWGPYISGLAKNYGVRYDNCGWNGALDALLGEGHGCKYPNAAGIGTVMEQTAMNGGAVWDGPELIWTEDFQNLSNSTVDGYTRRNWGLFPGMEGAWIDMFRQVINGTMHIPTRQEVIDKTKVVVINDVSSGSDEDKYATWGNLYDGLYKQTDPFNRGNGQWMDNFCYFKRTGRYGTIPMVTHLYDEAASSIPVQVKKSARSQRWSTEAKKVSEFNQLYPVQSLGDLYVQRMGNQLVTYMPYTYLNSKTTATGAIPLLYNTCDSLKLVYSKLSSGLVREYGDHIDLYLNNFRNDTTTQQTDQIVIVGATAEPSFTLTRGLRAMGSATKTWDAERGTFTVVVKHNGPITLSINCTGSNERSLTAETPQPLELPKQPEPYLGEVIIEAEDMDYKNITSCVTDPYNWYPNVRGHAGNGFMDMGYNTAAALRHQLSLAEGGDYRIGLRYTSPQKGGNVMLTVNGSRKVAKLEQTANNEWRKVWVAATMKAGKNNLVVANTGGVPSYIDQVIYRPADAEEELYIVDVRDAANGTVTADVEQAAEGQTVTLTVTPDEGYALTELRLVNSVFFTLAQTIDVTSPSGEITFTMPDDNVTIQPVFTDVTSVYNLDFAAMQNGNIPEGWRCTQEGNDVHEYPNNYGQGARVMKGFTGYQGQALYWREVSAEYGRQPAYPLALQPGEYKLTYAMAAWKATPKYKVQVINASTGNAIATSAVYTATPNANGSTTANLSSATERVLEFNVTEAANYVVKFTNESNNGYLDEYLLLECRVNSSLPTGVSRLEEPSQRPAGIYSPSGMRLTSAEHGLNIIVRADGSVRKQYVK